MGEIETTDTCIMCGLLIEHEATGVALIAAERARQVEKEGFDAERDDGYVGGELPDAAGCYCAFAALCADPGVAAFPPTYASLIPPAWPFDAEQWKVDKDDPVRALAKAGALIAAEIDRRLRMAVNEGA